MTSTPARRALASLLLAVLVTAACAWPAHAWAGAAGLQALLLAAAVCALGALGGHGVGALVRGVDPSPQAAPRATQASMAARLFLTLGLSLPVFLAGLAAKRPFAVWLGVHYLSQLALEVFASLRELGQNRGPNGTPARVSRPEVRPPQGPPTEERADHPEGEGQG